MMALLSKTPATIHRVLVVDDNESIQNDFSKILGVDEAAMNFSAEEDEFFGTVSSHEGAGVFDLDFASQGQAALDKVEEAKRNGMPYSVVFMDVRMPPGWDGIETTVRLWEVDPDLQVVICTAYSDYSWEEMIARLGRSDRFLILKKPFDAIEVIQLAHALAAKWSLHRESCRNEEVLRNAVRERTAHLEREMMERQRSEEALKFTQFSVDHSSEMMFWVGPDSGVVYANRSACQTLGYDVSEIQSMGLRDLVPRLDEGDWQRFWENVSTKVKLELEMLCRTRAGTHFPAEITLNYINFGGRQLLCVSAKDITRRRRILSELSEARDAALESSRLKGQFLANMSHEIRTPMNGVIGMGELLLHTALDREQREYVETIRISAELLLGIINDILDSSKIDSGHLRFEDRDFDLREVVEGTLAVVSPTAKQKGIELAGFVPEEGHHMLRGDSGRLKQVLTNMLGNAVKFTERGEVSLGVTELEKSEHEVTLRFEVADTGIGIPSEALARIFEPFHQADPSDTRKYGGTGLGLTICRQIVGALGGRLGVNSEVGKGSVFWFELSFRKSVGLLAAEVPEIPKGLRVLVVDDNATNCKILRVQLSNLHLDAQIAEGAEDTLALLRDAAESGRPYALALVDMQMPGVDGMELARRIRQDPLLVGTQVIILSSLGESLSEESLREAGVVDYLCKPVKQSRLEQALGGIFGRKEAVTVASADPSVSEPANRLRILLAEDNPVNQKVAMLQLKKLGYRADLAADGSEVLEALEKSHYDLILMDCQMPKMDGYEATRRIRNELGHSTVIVAMTANAMDGDRERCLACGMDDHLGKPVTVDELKRILEKWGASVSCKP